MREIRFSARDSQSAPTIWSSPCPPPVTIPTYIYRRTRNHCRLHYEKLDPYALGLLVCCGNGRAIGIHVFKGITNELRTFAASMNHAVQGRSDIYWVFFSININESIEMAWIRNYKGLSFSPVLVVSSIAFVPSFIIAHHQPLKTRTSLGRIGAFGSHPSGEIQTRYEYHPLVSSEGGIVTGIFHDSLDPESRFISEVGVTWSHLEPPTCRKDRGRRIHV